MTHDAKKSYEAHMARQEARVEVNAALKASLRKRVAPARRPLWLLPAFTAFAVAVIVLVTAQPTPYEVAMSPGFQVRSEQEAIELKLSDELSSSTADFATMTDDNRPVLTDDGREIPGLRGSYCEAGICADMIAPPEMLRQSGGEFMEVSAPLLLTLPREAENVQFGLLTEDGVGLLCDLDTEQLSPTTYSINSCGDAGQRYFLSVGIYWQDGGDASYYYPIAVE